MSTEDTSAEAAIRVLSALASDKRLRVLDWLADPERHFPPQKDGDLVEDGVCSIFISEKLGVTQPTTSQHMKILLDARLVRAKAQKGWTFYRLDPAGMARARELVNDRLGSTERPTYAGGADSGRAP